MKNSEVDMSDVQGPKGPPSPEDTYTYQYKKSVELFENALNEYHKVGPENSEQREEFKQVMKKALHVMNEIASEVIKDKLQKEKDAKLEKDFQKFLKDHKDKNQEELEKDYKTLSKDIEDLRNSFLELKPGKDEPFSH